VSNVLNLAEKRFHERMIERENKANVNPHAAAIFADKMSSDIDTATASGLTYGAVMAALAANFLVLCEDLKEPPEIAFTTLVKFDRQARAEARRAIKKLPPPESA
jgi:hypothetical protein